MKIAITQRVIEYRNGPYDSLDHGFYSMFRDHQLLPIPNNAQHYSDLVIAQADAVVFTGGNSMDPDNWQYNDIRLQCERRALQIALNLNKPIVGISRGCQFLTTELGGTIVKTDRHKKDHAVYYNNTAVTVCSRHEECLDQLPEGAQVLATDAQGCCESWQRDRVVTVLWHPERMSDHWVPDEMKQVLKL